MQEFENFDYPEQARSAAQFASTCSGLFTQQGAIPWSSRFEGLATGLAAFAAGFNDYHSRLESEIESFFPDLETSDVIPLLMMIWMEAQGDRAILETMVDAAESGQPMPGFDFSLAWAKSLQQDTELLLAVGIAFDAFWRPCEVDYVAVTRSARCVIDAFDFGPEIDESFRPGLAK